jgi:cellulose synthase/poly-beta-1,6-N-acetylglucosamine synthase-like glycosyltransferase
MKKSIAIILPAFNEDLTIVDTILSFYNSLPTAEIWVVNNNSSDNTKIFALNILKEYNIKGGVIDEVRQGKGNALRAAFHSIDADIYVISDADMTYPAYQISSLILPILSNQADMVVGDRLIKGIYDKVNKRFMHSFGNSLVKNLVNFLFNSSLNDVMSGYRSFSRQFIKNYPILVQKFEVETDMTLHALDKKFRITEIPIDYKDRPFGSYSKLNTYTDGCKVIISIFNILRNYRPLYFYGFLSSIFFILGLFTGLPVIEEYIKYKHILHLPLAILATGLELVSLIFMSIGIVLNFISIHEKRFFELNLLSKRNY